MTPAERLRELARRLEGGDELERWLAAGLRDYLQHAPEGRTLDESLGVATTPGEAPWWRQEALQARDEALRRLAAKHFGDLGIARQAEAVAQAVRRYRQGRWPHDRGRADPPPAGTARELLFAAMRAGEGRVPTSGRHLRRILAQRLEAGHETTGVTSGARASSTGHAPNTG